jgi:integral membrane sensor domain MASE1
MDHPMLYLFGSIVLACLLASIIGLSLMLQHDQQYTDIKRTSLTWIWPVTITGLLAAAIFGIFYFYADNGYYMYLLLGAACLSLGLSISAFLTAVMSKREP